MSDGDSENDRLVVDNGTWMCKAGWSGDKTARAYVPTIIGERHGSECFGDVVKYGSGIDPTMVRCPMERGIVTSWDDMEDFWHHILEQELRIRSNENITMLITEVPLNPKGNREKMIEVLMEKFSIQALSVYDPATLALISSGRVSGITLDVGHSVTHTSVVVDGFSVIESVRRIDLGGQDVSAYLSKKLRTVGYSISTTRELLDIEAMKHEIGLTYGMGGVSGESFELPDGTVIQDSDVANCHQVLFHPELLDLNLGGIDSLLFESISNCESDIKNTLCSNIILAGGPTMCKDLNLGGIDSLLFESISNCESDIKNTLCSNIILAGGPTMCKELPGHISKCIDFDVKSKDGVAQVTKVIAPPERKKSVWLGGSIVASLPDFLKRCISRRDYFEHGPTIIHSVY